MFRRYIIQNIKFCNVDNKEKNRITCIYGTSSFLDLTGSSISLRQQFIMLLLSIIQYCIFQLYVQYNVKMEEHAVGQMCAHVLLDMAVQIVVKVGIIIQMEWYNKINGMLEIKDTTECNTFASYLDLLLLIGRDGQLRTSLCVKRNDLNFHITNFPFLSSNIQFLPAYGFLSHKSYGMIGLAPLLNVLFWRLRDFIISFSNRDMSGNICNRLLRSSMVDGDLT